MAKQATVELIVVGNELLNGTTLDTNSHWLSKRLANMGALVTRKTTMRDNLRLISSAFAEALRRRPNWIFSIGGLGPTFDDMTLKGLSIAVHEKIQRNERAVDLIREFRSKAKKFRKIPRNITKSTLKMAELPKGSRPLRNTAGTAPGVLTSFAGTRVVSLPGVPREMKAIFSKEVEPLLLSGTAEHRSKEIWLRVKGITESAIAPKIAALQEANEPSIYIKSHAIGFREGLSLLKIQVIATYSPRNEASVLQRLEDVASKLESIFRKMHGRAERIR